ncbi:phage antirepressor [Lactobacillus johnsonii]|uniref:phage antirepressor n=1 Tax=Lactobacillus johnsonii TaxID=33959 RepID=UPI00107EB62A|nr:phage antirepressor KilAC domain-containing protein [Lactobacillus johnsonii]TGA95000.1 phage repressor protein/antirepressor Ant [Lactobacillus johnsonii]
MNYNYLFFQNYQLRTLKINNEPWFVGRDLATILGYSNTRDALNRHVELEDKGVAKLDTPGGKQEQTIVNESGMYSLILSSKLPNAKQFKRWVTSEVLPAIRKRGAYMTDEKAFDVVHNKNGLADLLQQAAEQLKQKDIEIAEMKPKAVFADSVATSHTTVLVGELAKILKGNGINIGANRLFAWMRKNGYLINRKGSDWNMPTQKSMNLGLFKIKETAINHSNGTTSISKTPKVTGKGQQYFVNKLSQAEI